MNQALYAHMNNKRKMKKKKKNALNCRVKRTNQVLTIPCWASWDKGPTWFAEDGRI
jgi:hypothetical protein